MQNKFSIKKIIIYLLILLFIYPVSPVLFTKFLSIKEPYFISPVPAYKEIRIRTDAMGDGKFNARRSNGTRKHKGLDIAGNIGDSVIAAKSGIAKTGEVAHGIGKYVTISHPGGYSTRYGHLDSLSIGNRTWVWQGQEIGKLGKTGNANYRSMKPHVHFEIRKADKCKDPMPYLNKECK